MMTVVITPLKKRAEFLALRQAPTVSTPAFRLVRGPSTKHIQHNTSRVGFTVTKRLGNAVTRNRIKRRLKSVVNAVFPLQAEANADYVVIAHHAAFDRPFATLVSDMEKALSEMRSGLTKARHGSKRGNRQARRTTPKP